MALFSVIPGRNDGIFGLAGLVYNDQGWSMGTSTIPQMSLST